MKKKNSILVIILLVLVVGVVGLTLAYFSNTASVDNTFNTKKYGTTVDEVFESPDNWTPGTTTPIMRNFEKNSREYNAFLLFFFA